MYLQELGVGLTIEILGSEDGRSLAPSFRNIYPSLIFVVLIQSE